MNLISQAGLDVERWRRIESVLDLALELEPHAVPAFLDRACAGSPELRREVEALLDADRRATGFMAVAAALLVDPFAEGAAAPMPERIGRYTVFGELGRGGMGIVYEGRDEARERRVALKALPAAVAADPGRLARFLAEARLLGALQHPHLAAIHGIERAGEQRYLVLERIDGVTLAERLRAGALPLAEALEIAAQVAEALAAAHALGIVHRDLKPGNVMLTRTGLVKVLDLGLAMHVSDGADGADAPAWARAGTPGYMSPEQVRGEPQDARTDVFAFGVLLYQCLVGARPFAGDSPAALVAATLEQPVDFARLPAGTPVAVRTLLGRALERDPARRPADAGELAAALALAIARPQRAAGAAATPGSRLPEAAGALIGRERELEATRKLLARSALVTLTGAGGCGKSRLALEVARGFPGAVWHADLAAVTDAPGIASVVAAAAGLREAGEAALCDALLSKAGEGGALLVLDHCDHALGECAALVARLLGSPSALRVLATSRERLGVDDEQTLRVPPLALPDPEVPPTRASVGEAAAVQLFVARAHAATPRFELVDSNAALVREICRDLDGVPLALELTAALLAERTLASVAADLDARLRPAGGAGPEAHPDTLPAAMALSYERLTGEERQCFRALSVFAGGWSLEAATAVCRDDGDAFGALDLLTRLLDKSLVTVERGDRLEPRYRFLEPIRHFAAVRCDAERESAALRTRHLDWCLALAERLAPTLVSGATQARALATLEAEHPNLALALRRADAVPDGAAKALRLAGAVWWFWYVRGHFTRGREALAHALALPGAEAPTPQRALALFAAGGLAVFQGDYAEGERLSQAALVLFRTLGDPLGIARALSHLALCESGQGRYAEAGERYARAIAIFREVDDKRRLSAALNNLGVLARQQGDFAAALAHHEEALACFRLADDRDGTLVTLVNLGLASVRLGRVASAGRWVDEALALAQELRAKRAGAAALQVAAEILLARGLAAEAARLVGAARALRAALAMAPDEWWRRSQEELAARLENALGVARFTQLTAEGGASAFEPALALARHLLSPGNAGRDA